MGESGIMGENIWKDDPKKEDEDHTKEDIDRDGNPNNKHKPKTKDELALYNGQILNLISQNHMVLSGNIGMQESVLVKLVKIGMEIPNWIDRVSYLNLMDIILSSFDNNISKDNYLLVFRSKNGEEDVVTVNHGATSYLGKEIFNSVFEDKDLLKALIGLNYPSTEEQNRHSDRLLRVNSYLNGGIDYESLRISDILKVIPNRLRITDIDKLGYVIYNIKNQETESFKLEKKGEFIDSIEGELRELGTIADFTRPFIIQIFVSRERSYELHRTIDKNFILVETKTKARIENNRRIMTREQTELMLDMLTSVTLAHLRLQDKRQEIDELLKLVVSSAPRKRRDKTALQEVFNL